mmetsp:Transcript_29081/g.86074  ORF Transcript_29081/g.86074 Transcript_29081/m.86074 type:complete len:205 (-) Transcript_29081:290-904(-)
MNVPRKDRFDGRIGHEELIPGHRTLAGLRGGLSFPRQDLARHGGRFRSSADVGHEELHPIGQREGRDAGVPPALTSRFRFRFRGGVVHDQSAELRGRPFRHGHRRRRRRAFLLRPIPGRGRGLGVDPIEQIGNDALGEAPVHVASPYRRRHVESRSDLALRGAVTDLRQVVRDSKGVVVVVVVVVVLARWAGRYRRDSAACAPP